MTPAPRTRTVLLLVVALLLRLGWVGYSTWQHGTTFAYPDETLHWQLATNLVQRGELVSDDGRHAARMPAYPLFLAAFAGLGERGVIAARVVQAVAGTITVLLVVRLATRLTGSRAAWMAGLLAALDPFAVFFTNLLLTETLFTTVLVAFAAAAVSLRDAPRAAWGGSSALAICGALLILIRPSSAALVPLMWIAIVWLARERRAAAARVALAVVALLAALLPWGLRNMAVLGSPAWLSTNGGATLYDALGPQADGSSNQQFFDAMPELATLSETACDARLRALALDEIRAHPARVLGLVPTKFARTWNPFPNVAEYRQGAVAWVGAAYTLTLYALCGVGLLRSKRVAHLKAALILLALPVLYFAAVHSVYIGSVRYRVPVMPLLAVVGAVMTLDGRPRERAA